MKTRKPIGIDVVTLTMAIGTLLSFTRCHEQEDPLPDEVQHHLKGAVQVGMATLGSTVAIRELDEYFMPNGNVHAADILEESRAFELKQKISSPYVEIRSEGYYVDAASGHLTASGITFQALEKVEATTHTHVNVLTTLIADRIIHLLRSEETSFEEAVDQAEAELLNAFGITLADADFSAANMLMNTEEAAILIAISAVLQGHSCPTCNVWMESGSVAEWTTLLAALIIDFREDGMLNEVANLRKLKRNAANLDLHMMRSNLQNKHISSEHQVPDFEKYAKRLVDLKVADVTPVFRTEGPLNNIKITFNKPLDEASIGSLSLQISVLGTLVPGHFEYDDYNYTVSFIPSQVVPPSVACSITINDLLKGIDALSMPELFEVSFMTEGPEIHRSLKSINADENKLLCVADVGRLNNSL